MSQKKQDPKNLFALQKEQEFEFLCSKQGLSQTTQRRMILLALARRKDHPTADQIYEELKEQFKGLSRTTVYRVLETFVRIGLVQKTTSLDAKARFDADTGRHHHITCMECGEVVDLHDPLLNRIELPEEKASGYRLLDYSIAFTGICPQCRAK